MSGSLRAASSNTALLEAAALLAPAGMTVRHYPSVGVLPHFNPDVEQPESGSLPSVVAELRTLVGQSDAILISSPEYAHGLPGAFKNALDWLVGSSDFPGKPVASIRPMARSTHAEAQLREILTTMAARLIDGGWRTVPLPHREMSAQEIAAEPALACELREVLAAIARA